MAHIIQYHEYGQIWMWIGLNIYIWHYIYCTLIWKLSRIVSFDCFTTVISAGHTSSCLGKTILLLMSLTLQNNKEKIWVYISVDMTKINPNTFNVIFPYGQINCRKLRAFYSLWLALCYAAESAVYLNITCDTVNYCVFYTIEHY